MDSRSTCHVSSNGAPAPGRGLAITRAYPDPGPHRCAAPGKDPCERTPNTRQLPRPSTTARRKRSSAGRTSCPSPKRWRPARPAPNAGPRSMATSCCACATSETRSVANASSLLSWKLTAPHYAPASKTSTRWRCPSAGKNPPAHPGQGGRCPQGQPATGLAHEPRAGAPVATGRQNHRGYQMTIDRHFFVNTHRNEWTPAGVNGHG